MPLKIVGAGFGRTGTNSLRLALNQLGVGPCYHMEEVLMDLDNKVRPWIDAADGRPDWDHIFAGYNATVDWPSASYWKPIFAHYSDAKVILSTRTAGSWYDSFSGTIAQVISAPEKLPPALGEWIGMGVRLINGAVGGAPIERDRAIAAFDAYEADVKASVPRERLLVFRASDGWEPLCRFLDVPVPTTPYPRTNNKEEFFKNLAGAP